MVLALSMVLSLCSCAVAEEVTLRVWVGDNNDLRSSDVLRRMQDEILPKIVAEVGEENLCTIKTDLTTLDGLRINANLEALDASGEPIAGLYAIGDCSGSFFMNSHSPPPLELL